MDTIFMSSENSKASYPHILLLYRTDKIELRRDENSVALTNCSIYYTWKNINTTYNNHKSYNNNKFKISAPTWNDKFELPEEWYSIWSIQDYVEYILKKHGENSESV